MRGIAAVPLVGVAIEAWPESGITTTAPAFGLNTFVIFQAASAGTSSLKEIADKLRRDSDIYRREAEALGRHA